jgi:hypothetical protein
MIQLKLCVGLIYTLIRNNLKEKWEGEQEWRKVWEHGNNC